MKNFIDNQGRQWTLEVNTNTMRPVRDFVGVDLAGLVADRFKPWDALLSDPCKYVDVIYCLCKSEADARKVDAADFGRAMIGDALELSSRALMEEIINFFPIARRKMLTEALRMYDEFQAGMLVEAEKMIQAVNMQECVRSYIASLGSAPASLASTPDPSRSAN